MGSPGLECWERKGKNIKRFRGWSWKIRHPKPLIPSLKMFQTMSSMKMYSTPPCAPVKMRSFPGEKRRHEREASFTRSTGKSFQPLNSSKVSTRSHHQKQTYSSSESFYIFFLRAGTIWMAQLHAQNQTSSRIVENPNCCSKRDQSSLLLALTSKRIRYSGCSSVDVRLNMFQGKIKLLLTQGRLGRHSYCMLKRSRRFLKI